MGRTVERMGVLGGGQMGAGIAQVAAQAGVNVHVVDISDDAIARCQKTIDKGLGRLLSKERITAHEKSTIEGRLVYSTDPKDFAHCDLIVEAVSENLELKLKIFADLDEIAKPNAILASNTSSISITKIAAATKRPEQVIGMHFMNPVPVMKLVEIIRGLATSDEVQADTVALAQRMGKTTVESEDYPGFIVNRVLMPMINEACYALMEGVGSVEDIDTAMKLGCNHPMGPFELADFIGLDTCLAIMETLHEGYCDTKYRPCPLLRKYVTAGWYGRKSGRGFYTYDR